MTFLSRLSTGTAVTWAVAGTRPALTLPASPQVERHGLSLPASGSGGFQELPARTGKPDRQLHT